jgi:DNA-binding CsgD family transcriptional regulator
VIRWSRDRYGSALGHALLAAGRARDALQELERAGESQPLTGADRADGLAWASFACIMLGELGRAVTVAEQARSAAAAAGDHLALSIALTSLAGAAEFSGHLPEALEIIDDAVRLADQSPAREGHRFQLQLPRAHILLELDRLDEARAALEGARRISDEFGVRWHLPSYQAARGVERFIAGEWDDAIAELEASVALADETGSKYSLMYALGARSVISLHRADLRGARQAAAAAAAQLSATGLRFRVQWAIWAQALVLEAEGKTAEALAALAGCWDQCAELGLTVEYPVFGADLVRLALACGERGRAGEVTAAVAEIAAQNQVAALTGAALRCRGLTDDDPGALLAAAEAYAGGQRPLALALAAEDAGAAFARHGDAGRARPLLEQATQIYERLGAARDLARAEAALREAGIRRGRRGTRNRPRVGWQSLIPTERAVADLVADGLSNPQIGERLYISRRTVQTHLAHMFAKLDLSARAQLAAEVTRRRNEPQAGR